MYIPRPVNLYTTSNNSKVYRRFAKNENHLPSCTTKNTKKKLVLGNRYNALVFTPENERISLIGPTLQSLPEPDSFRTYTSICIYVDLPIRTYYMHTSYILYR